MKRFLSIVLTLALVLTTLVIPAAATTETAAAVDITSIKDGDTYTAGSNISLAADASTLADVKNIDFFANGTKLPGTIVGNTGKIIWYAPSEGVYDITTQVTYTSEATAPGNETVKVTVLPAATDLHMLWPGDYGITIPNATESTEIADYAIYGKSAMITLPAGDSSITIDLKDTAKKGTGYAGVLIYAPETIEGVSINNPAEGADLSKNANRSYVKLSTNSRAIHTGTTAHKGITKGFNKYVTTHGFATTAGKEDTYFDSVLLRFYGVPEDDTPIYICGIYEFVNTTPVVPKASAVLDGKEAVCNEVGTFRIDLDGAIFPYATTTPVAVKKVDGETETDVDIKGYKLGSDYVDVYLNTLELESTYKVSVLENTLIAADTANNHETTNAMIYMPAADFTFTTKDTDCENATPVVKMSYPADGATCLADTGFAAKLVSGSSAIDSVKFYNGDDEIVGTVTKMTDGEYWLTPDAAALTVGAATVITVKALNAEGGELATASATYTGATKPVYYLKGIYNGEAIIKQEEYDETADTYSRVITVVDDANKESITAANQNATNVSRVEFYEKGVLVDTDVIAPYQRELVFGDCGEYSYQVKVYDVFGNVTSFGGTYNLLDGVKNPASYDAIDFESYTASTTQDTLIKDLIQPKSDGYCFGTDFATMSVEEPEEGATTTNRLKIGVINDGDTKADYGYVQFKAAPSNNGHKVHIYEFNLWTKNDFAHNFRVGRVFGYNSSGQYNNLFTNQHFYQLYKQGAKVRIVLDYNYDASVEGDCPTAVISINGTEYRRVDLDGLSGDTGVFQLVMHDRGSELYIDNLSYTAYDVKPDYAVKGIYDGAVMVKEHEPNRTITVVDKAYAEIASSTATGVSKVEFYKDDVLVNTDEDGTDSWSYALANDTYGAHKLEVKVTDIYGEAHSYVRNYTVVEGVKNAASFTENFDGFDAATVTDEELQEAIIANNSEKYLISSTPLVLETRNGSNALKLKADGNTGYIQFKGAPSETGRRVHYYEFDMSSYTAYSSTFYVRGDAYNTSTHGVELFNTQSYLYGTTRIFSNLNNVVRKVRIVLDYNETAPTATISFDGNEWTTVSLADAVAGTGDPALVLNAHKNANASPIYIDNFKYSVYDYPSRFGKGEYEDEIIFESRVNSKGETVYTGPQEFNTYFTNTTGADVTVKNFIVVYDKDGRLVFIYGDDRTNQTDPDTGEVKFKSDQQTYTYPAGVVNQPAHYEWNMGAPEGRSAKIFTYIIDSETGELDLTPISKFE